jgi:hypothetical protein
VSSGADAAAGEPPPGPTPNTFSNNYLRREGPNGMPDASVEGRKTGGA